MTEQLREISIILDVWDDIFSDFDPRPLDERALSEDFIAELRKRYTETASGDLLISFCAPKGLKDDKSEKMVVHRLRNYFVHRALQQSREIYDRKMRGVVFILVGVVFLSSTTLVAYFDICSTLAVKLLEILLVPLGWFGIWEGFSKIVNASPALAQEATLFRKLSIAKYQFHYES